VVAFASSLDQVGPLAKSVRDAALLLNAIAGADAQDSTSLREDVVDFTAALGRSIKGMRVGVAKEHSLPGVDSQVRSAVDMAVAHLESLGAEIVEI
jgi:aspartyl-tRNA(Asn)/glutamyl-tRNA(Gln) amidotransferase subunit A